MKLFYRLFPFLVVLLVILNPSIAYGEYEQYFERIHYTHFDRTSTQPSLETKKVLGPEDALVTVYIWGSLNEPHAQKFFLETFPQLKDTYQNVKFVFNHRPFDYHGEAGIKAAKLAECTAVQNQFWSTIETQINIANNQSKLTDLTSLSQSELIKCLNKPATAAVISDVAEDADLLGINSVPTIIIKNPNSDPNAYDIKVIGAQELVVFEEAFSQIMGEINGNTEEVNENSGLTLEERTASLEAELATIKNEQSFIQSQIEKLLALVDTVLNTIQL